MENEKKFAHLSYLQPQLSVMEETRHLSVGEPMESQRALTTAKKYNQVLPNTKGLVFIEGEGARATVSLDCSYCDKRERRYDFYSFPTKI